MTSFHSTLFESHTIDIHNEDPKVFTIDNFFTQEECQHIIDVGKPKLANSGNW